MKLFFSIVVTRFNNRSINIEHSKNVKNQIMSAIIAGIF